MEKIIKKSYPMQKKKLINSARHIVQHLREKGFQSYWVGGCVRDLLLGRPAKDIDIATNATPDTLLKIFPNIRTIGKAFGVVQVQIDKAPFEIATFRKDFDYRDGRHPERVAFASPEEDAQRRDFTINGLFYDPLTETVIDFVQGQKDLKNKIIRTIGNPQDRFREDHLRMLRAIRFASTLEFSIETETVSTIKQMATNLKKISPERIQQEFTRTLLESPQPGSGVRLLQVLNILNTILPEVSIMAYQNQPPEYHPEGDVLTHTLMMLDNMKTPDAVLAYAVLLHDVGKPPTASMDIRANGKPRIRFNGHAKVGAELAETILKRLRIPTHRIKDVVHCVRNHMRFMEVSNMKKSTLRRLIGAPTFNMELELHRLDCLCSHGNLSNYNLLRTIVQKLENEPVLPSPWINGHDIMNLGVAKGPKIGAWLKKAYDAQVEGTVQNRENLLEWIKKEEAKV
ncbi:MAG: HD domain-containing protein [Kiritimatiellae bacterium]|nr:HD domain-containing protein [Kiritimatiellia bacterium]